MTDFPDAVMSFRRKTSFLSENIRTGEKKGKMEMKMGMKTDRL